MAIASQLAETQQTLAQQLQLASTVNPNFSVDKVQVQERKVRDGERPIYHLRGTCEVTLQLPGRRVKQDSPFELYLQPVPEEQGRTWMLIPDDSASI